MKTIQVSDEQFEALSRMAKNMHTQDNRITANPIFCVYQKEERPAEEGRYQCFYTEDHDHRLDAGDNDELVEWFKKNQQEILDSYDVTKEELDTVMEEHDMFMADEIVELLKLQRHEYDIVDVAVTGQYYFTEEACHRHIKANSYHYTEPHSFVESAWRNPEMQLLREVVMSLHVPEEVPAE